MAPADDLEVPETAPSVDWDADMTWEPPPIAVKVRPIKYTYYLWPLAAPEDPHSRQELFSKVAPIYARTHGGRFVQTHSSQEVPVPSTRFSRKS